MKVRFWAAYRPGEEPVIGPVLPERCHCGAWRLPDQDCAGCRAFAEHEEREYGSEPAGCCDCADIWLLRLHGMTWVGIDLRTGHEPTWAWRHANRHQLEDPKPCAFEQPEPYIHRPRKEDVA